MAGGSEDTGVPNWLRWARKLDAIAQAGLTYCENDFDRERYAQLRALAGEILAAQAGADPVVVTGWFAAPAGVCHAQGGRAGGLFPRRQAAPGPGAFGRRRWCLPGGWADVGDAPSVSAEREVVEETGYQARGSLIGVFDANRNHDDGKPRCHFTTS